jgi:hypothetical protein
VHISISNNFCNYGIVGCHKKWIFHVITVREGLNVWFLWGGYQGQDAEAPLQFLKVWDLEGWPYPWFHHFSRYACIYWIFCDIWMFIFEFELLVYRIHFKIYGGKYPCSLYVPWGVEPQKPCMSYLSAPSGRLSTHHRLDLDSNSKFILINLQTWPPSIHGV